MASTTRQDLRNTELTELSDDVLDQLISDAQDIVEIKFSTLIQNNQSSYNADLQELFERYMTLHLAKMNEHQLQSDSVENKSLSFATPSGDIFQWLRNSRPGRTLVELIQSVGGDVGRPTPKTFR